MKNLIAPSSNSPLNKWLNYIEKLHKKSIDLSLKRIYQIAVKLDLLKVAPIIIIVGGTNGKGTTCRLIENILLISGIKVGVYSSPHLLDYTERIRIHGKELSEDIHSESMSIIETIRDNVPLSYFEFGTLAALQLFKQASLEVVILEVGLGGRFDATNIVNADISVITSIGLDHTDWLGSNRNSIAWEKAGIFRFKKSAIIGEPNPPYTIYKAAKYSEAILYCVNRDWWWEYDKKNKKWHWRNSKIELKSLPLPKIPIDNAATAIAVISKLPFIISENFIRQGIKITSLPGRFQYIGNNPLTILDVAHNPHATDFLSRKLYELNYGGKLRAVVGMLTSKDITNTLKNLYKQVDFWYCSTLYDSRTASASYLAKCIKNNKVQKFENIINAWIKAIFDSASEDYILVFGSFYAVSPILRYIKLNSLIK